MTTVPAARPYLFDTDAISEVLRPRPLPTYIDWLRAVPREHQFTSAVSVGELFKGAFRSTHTDRHLENIRTRLLPALTVLPFDEATAEVFGMVAAHLELAGQTLPDADLQIAATALYHGLELVTGNIRHFGRIEGLRVCRVLAQAREET